MEEIQKLGAAADDESAGAEADISGSGARDDRDNILAQPVILARKCGEGSVAVSSSMLVLDRKRFGRSGGALHESSLPQRFDKSQVARSDLILQNPRCRKAMGLFKREYAILESEDRPHREPVQRSVVTQSIGDRPRFGKALPRRIRPLLEHLGSHRMIPNPLR